jgi:hypothetical protein
LLIVRPVRIAISLSYGQIQNLQAGQELRDGVATLSVRLPPFSATQPSRWERLFLPHTRRCRAHEIRLFWRRVSLHHDRVTVY